MTTSLPAAGRPATAPPTQTAVLLLVQMKPGARLWGSLRLVIGRFALRREPGLAFFKILGSGHEGGFGLRPSADRLGLFALFDSDADAERFVRSSPVMRAWQSHALEAAWLQLACFSSRGAWAGRVPQVRVAAPPAGPIAVLTRASIRPARALAFWRRSPATERALLAAPGCLLATGLGEAPFLRQATFSVWQSLESLDGYARQGVHREAARAAHDGGWFSESLFARFAIVAQGGTWKGRALG